MTRLRTLARIAGVASILVILGACGSMPMSVFGKDEEDRSFKRVFPAHGRAAQGS